MITYFDDKHGQTCQYKEERLPQASTRRKVENPSPTVLPLRLVPTRRPLSWEPAVPNDYSAEEIFIDALTHQPSGKRRHAL